MQQNFNIVVLGNEALAQQLADALPQDYCVYQNLADCAEPVLVLADLGEGTPPELVPHLAKLAIRPKLLLITNPSQVALKKAIKLCPDGLLPSQSPMPAALYQIQVLTLAANISGYWLEERRRAFFAKGSGIDTLRELDTLHDLFERSLGVYCLVHTIIGASYPVVSGLGRDTILEGTPDLWRQLTKGDNTAMGTGLFSPVNDPHSEDEVRSVSGINLVRHGRLPFNLGMVVTLDNYSKIQAFLPLIAEKVTPALAQALTEFDRTCQAWDWGRLENFTTAGEGLVQELERVQSLFDGPDGADKASHALANLKDLINYRVQYCEQHIEASEGNRPTVLSSPLDLDELWGQDGFEYRGKLNVYGAVPNLPILADFLGELFRLFRMLGNYRSPSVRVNSFKQPPDQVIQVECDRYKTRSERDAWFAGFARESAAVRLFETRLILQRAGILVRDSSGARPVATSLDIRVPLILLEPGSQP